jgi:two-component system NtrC family response regulator
MRERSSGAKLLKKLYPTRSESVRRLLRTAEKLLDVSSNVLIAGETGAGKDYLAEALHRCSTRSGGPFLRIDCASIPADLFESELFGHERGAFTDAHRQKLGKLEQAQGGTVYLDDVGSLDPALQAKLLRVVQERQFTRLGGTRLLPLDVRFLSSIATASSESERFEKMRSDLLYRLAVVTIDVPPLRERREDVPILARGFLRSRVEWRATAIRADAMERLQRYSWPGNVRQLKNVIERAVILAGGEITPRELPESLMPVEEMIEQAATGGWSLAELERQYITRILEQSGDNNSRAARLLGISRKTLLEKRKRYGLSS